MKTVLFILSFFAVDQLFSQDTTVTWLNNIDSSAFIVHYNKKDIPLELYSIIGIKKDEDIANPNKPYQIGCVGSGNLPFKRLNWIANDSSNHWIICISYGGYASGTKYYFIDKEKGNLNTNIFYFNGPATESLSWSFIISRLKARRFIRG